jgi:hypothetical protein
MSLTPEQKARILEEERLRFAEEQYREEVRRELRAEGRVSPPLPMATSPASVPSAVLPQQAQSGRTLLRIVGIVFVLCALYLVIGSPTHFLATHKEETQAVADMVSYRKTIISAPFTVPALHQMVLRVRRSRAQ